MVKGREKIKRKIKGEKRDAPPGRLYTSQWAINNGQFAVINSMDPSIFNSFAAMIIAHCPLPIDHCMEGLTVPVFS
jgi:hypothetical protein